ncbi:mandelate racemase/muconate lactonizing enzyme family protein [bacterium]|nr:mandelate racemase/muconate lactonizing enzyme family protein [bacterium]
MKTTIADITTEICDAPFLSQLLVRVFQEDGSVGVGECWWGVDDPAARAAGNQNPVHLLPIVSTIEHLLKPLLIGQNAGQISDIRQKTIHHAYRYGTEGIFMCALSGIDLALWDLLGKRMGVPVAALLGGTVKEHIRAYASLPPLKTRSLIQQEVGRALDAGYTGIKLHETDPQTAGWARETAGPEIALMFDVNGAFSPLEAVSTARRLLEHDVYWFEEPVWPMRDQRALAEIGRKTGIRLAAGENEFTLERFYQLCRQDPVAVIMPEISKIGGLTVAREITVLAGLYNRTLSPHGFRVGPALVANIHWALSSPTSDWLEIPFLPGGYAFPAGVRPPELLSGRVSLPPGPGLGLEFL